MHICINYYYYFIKNTEQNTKWDEDKSVFRLFILNKINNSAHTQDLFRCILKVYFSYLVQDMPIPLLTDINSFKVH